ncbi:MAG: hypothetical protein JWM78_988 [Verrucomicrobiaceae bacterium]|nr:hypothetical protein [Verrucomicrobiaceae bacterium]
MTTPKFCRVAIIVNDMGSFVSDATTLLGLEFIAPSIGNEFPAIKVLFGEHGLEPIQVLQDVAFARDGRLIEVAIDVADAEATKIKFKAAGYQPVVSNFLPAPNAHEYLFGRDFHGLPVMVCTAGDNEKQMRVDGPFRELDAAPAPKIGCVSVIVDSIDVVSRDFHKLFGMTFVETDAGGLGARAVVGSHRVKLIEGPTDALMQEFEPPLAAIEFMFDDVEATREKLEAAGYPVKYTRALNSGGNAYYFGAVFQRMPLGIYPTTADAEILGC